MTCWRSCYIAFIYCVVIQICIVYSQDIRKSSLTFVIDDSGSMTDEIEQVKESVDSIFETVMMSNVSQIENFVLVTFNDPDYILHTVTTNQKVFQAAAELVHVRGGIPECPEKAMTGIKVAIENSLPLSTLYVFTDASAKDFEMFEEVKSMSQKKQIQVTFMLTGSCGSRADRKYQVYHQLAKATNGEVFNLIKTDIADILEYVKENIKSRSDIIESKKFPPGYGNILKYSVDSKLNDLIISVTGLKPKIEVTDSEGKKVDIKHIVNKDEIAIVKVTDLKPGVYLADVGSTSETYVKVMGKTTVNFYYGFSPFETDSLNDTAIRPGADGDAYLSIKLQGDGIKLQTVKIFDMDGIILEELPLRLMDEKERFYATKSFHPPSVAFQLSVFGYVEEDNSLIKRTSALPIERQNVKHETAVNVAPSAAIKEGPKIFVDYRSPLKLKCKVHGYPKPDITWQEKDSGVIIPSNVSTIEVPYDFMSLLHIEKPNKNSTYECKAHNSLDTNIASIEVETNIYFNVLERPPDTTEVKYGKEVNMRCIIDASPPASIAWYHNGSLLSNDTNTVISNDTGTVTIKHATLESQGTFMCEVKNEFSWKSFFAKVKVIGLEKPVIEKLDEKIRAVKGAEAQLTCRILLGTPKPTIQWYFQQQKAKKFRELEETNEALLLKNVSVDDMGTYTCNASNIVGSQSFTMDLTVEYPPAIKEDGINVIETEVGDEITLPCNVDGLPTPTVKWLRNGTTLHSSKNISTATDHSLKITTIDVSDTGYYTCEAGNHLGSSTKSIVVHVFEKPVIEKPDEKKRALKGTDLQLTCRILRGTPKPTIQWLFQHHMSKEFRELKETNEALLLKNVSVDDVGTYMCAASNKVGSQNFTMDLAVEYPPTIKEDGINVIETEVGDEVTLPCNVDGLPTPTVKWLRNGTTLHSSKNILTATDHSLKITTIDVSDTGYYTCEAGNHLGSSTKSIVVHVFEKPVIEKPDEKKRTLKGTDLQLTCRILRGTPKPTIQWLFQHHMSKEFRELKETNEALLLKNVSVDDVGTYMCAASNKVGSQNFTMDLAVEYPPTIKEDGINVIETEVGDEVTLPCNVDGLPTPTVKWLRNGTTLHSSKNILTATDHSLKITTIDVSDTGYYTCEAGNHLGSSTKSIVVHVFEKPVIEKPDEKKRALKGTDLQLTCRILRGTPKPTIQWLFQHHMSKEFRELKETYEALLLKNVSVDDVGTYMCAASNKVGSQNFTMDLAVEYPPTIKEDGINVIETEVGDEVTLPCNVDGLPTPTVKWLRNGTTLHSSKNILTATDHSLKITTIDVSDTGYYTCEAGNHLGSSTKSIVVHVFEKPVIEKPDEKKRTLKGTDLQLTCRILRGTPKPTIQWLFQHHMSKEFRELKETNEALLLKNVSVDDVGTYMCAASNKVGSQNFTMDLAVEYPPTIKEDGINVIETEVGDEVTLPCNVDGLPTPTVKWLRNGTTLHSSKNILTATDHSLKITTIDVSDTGYYTCEAGNHLGSSTKSIVVHVFEKPVIEKPDEKKRAVKGADLQLTCRILRGTPKPTIQWLFRHHMSKEFRELKETNEALLLKNVSVDDVGTYTCDASNKVGSQSFTMDLVVEYPPTIKEDGINVIETEVGDKVTLSCNVDGLPTPTVKWLRNGTTLHSSKNILTATDHSLKITKIDVSDTGYYTCEARNHLGSSTKSIVVHVFEKPVIEKPDEKRRAVKGADLQLTCRILRGTPKPTIQWLFQHYMSKESRELTETNEALLLMNVSVDDVGTYTCDASNKVGSQSFTMDLAVEYPPTIEEDGIKMIQALVGDVITLPCNVDGVPPPTVKWLRNGSTLRSSKNILTNTDHSLKIIAIEVPNTGSYSCEAENHLGSINKSIFVDVLEKPLIDKPDEKISALKGTDVQLACRILRGTPKPTTMWHFQQQKAKKFRELDETSEALLLKNVRVDDVGRYKCNVSNIVGSQSYTMDLTVEYPPTIKADGINTIETKVGDEVNLPCNVDGLPTPTVKWLRNGTTLRSSKNILATADHSLKIRTIEVSDTGYYTCEAKNRIGSSDKMVFVYVFEKPVIDKPYKETRAVKGTDVQLTCRILRGTPKPTMQWHFQHRKAKKFKGIKETNEFLLLKNVNIADVGTYMCNASNILGSQSYTMDLTVEYSPTIKADGINTIETKAGDEVTIPCNVDGLPTPTVKWLRNGTTLRSSKNILTIADHSLKIRTIEVSDTGFYTCEAKNRIGSSDKMVFVYVFEKPVIDKPYKETRAVKGTDAQLTCRILRGTPKPTMQWHFQHRKAKKFKGIKETNEFLLLKNVNIADVGTYMCNASNILGSQSYTMDLTVEYPPTIKEDGIKTFQALNGDEVTLPCNVDAVPTPTVKWLRNDIILHSSKNILTATDHSVKIRAIEVSDTGHYTCEANNRLGSSKKTIVVNVFEKPVVHKPDEKIRAVIGADVHPTCRILRGTPKPTIKWHFRKRKDKKFRELMDTNEALLLKNVSVDDVGTYMCNASNKVGSQSYTMDLTVEYPPTINDDGIKTMNARAGNEVTIPCNADGVPTPSVKWLKRGTTLHSSKKYLINPDHSLRITTIEVPNTGYYTCEAKNYLGSRKKTILVFVFVPARIEIPKLSTIDIMVGRDLTLPCHADGHPQPEIKWLFENFETKTASTKLLSSHKTSNFNLHRVQLSDQGYYTCVANNIGGTTEIKYTVNVNAAPIIENLYADKTFTCIKEDLVLRIQCKATGYPKPSIAWKKDELNIVSGSKWFDIEDGTLIIRNIEKGQQGTYTCLATNRIGYDSTLYNVIVNDYPFVSRPESTMFIAPGKSLDVPCGIPHIKTDFIRWYKDSRLIAYGELTLKKVTNLDIGVYSCRVSDIWKSHSAHVEIKMGYEPLFITKESEIINFKKGNYYPLTCLAKGKPEPKVTWAYNGESLSVTNMVYTIEMTLNNRGKYTCEISNSFGSIKRSFRMISQDCILDVKKDFLHDNQPMMLTPRLTWPIFTVVDGFMLIDKNEPFYLHCPKGFVKFRKPNIRAFCDGETQIKIHGKKYEYSEIKCKREIEPVIRKTKNRCLHFNTVNVEVGYKVRHTFLNVYSVCLDTGKNVPLYTRHTLSPAQYDVSTKKNVWWPSSLLPYNFDTIYNCKNQAYDISSILKRPFHNDNKCCFGKRQLVNPKDLKPGIPTSTANTYLNVVPHWNTCNSKNWADIEQKVRNLTKLLNTELTILTGTAKPLQMIGRSGYRNIVIHDDRRKKLPVAQHLWKVVQDPGSSSSLAIVQVNVPDLLPADVPLHVRCRDICEEIEWMKGPNWHSLADGYTYCCSILDFESAFNYRGQFSRGKTTVLNISPDYSDD